MNGASFAGELCKRNMSLAFIRRSFSIDPRPVLSTAIAGALNELHPRHSVAQGGIARVLPGNRAPEPLGRSRDRCWRMLPNNLPGVRMECGSPPWPPRPDISRSTPGVQICLGLPAGSDAKLVRGCSWRQRDPCPHTKRRFSDCSHRRLQYLARDERLLWRRSPDGTWPPRRRRACARSTAARMSALIRVHPLPADKLDEMECMRANVAERTCQSGTTGVDTPFGLLSNRVFGLLRASPAYIEPLPAEPCRKASARDDLARLSRYHGVARIRMGYADQSTSSLCDRRNLQRRL